MTYIIRYDRNVCIGAAVCAAVTPQFWIINKDGKADLAGAKKVSEDQFELKISDQDFEANREAAEGCPAIAIHVFKETGEKIV